MRGQVLAIVLVIACGVATFVMARSTIDSLHRTQTVFYSTYRFADIFATVKRAPMSVSRRLASLPGVSDIEPRVISSAKMSVAGFDEPISGYFVSVPDTREPSLNRLYLRRGRMVEPFRNDEIILSDGFAEAHGLDPGSTVEAIINGRKRILNVVGIALSPEFVYQMHPGALFPDFERTAVVWMGQQALSVALDMDGAFNNAALKLSPGAGENRVIDYVDEVLDEYGAQGAIPRADQVSHNYLTEEFRQLDQMATVMPAIFLGVAAFLLHVVMSRLISTQREVIAVLKAFGYSNLEVGAHYLSLVMVLVAGGSILGLGVGVWMGHGLGDLYMQYYRFPDLVYVLRPRVVIFAIGISALAATTGTILAVRSAVVLPPAEAMRPEPPMLFRASLLERMGFQDRFSQPVRMVIRHLERRPLRAGLTVAGISSACAVVMMGFFFSDAIDFMIDVQLRWGQREDIIVVFSEPTSENVTSSIRGIEGVEQVELTRFLDVELQHEHRVFRTNIQGMPRDVTLKRLFTEELEPLGVASGGLMLTEYTMNRLGVQVGDSVTVNVKEHARPVWRMPVTAHVKQYVGQLAYMDWNALHHRLGEQGAATAAYVTVSPGSVEAVYSVLQDAPRVSALILRERSINDFYESTGENWLFFSFVITVFAGIIAFGVIYNSARIALSERSRELASLRILGLTRGEISFILLAELAVLAVAAIPIGFLLGRAICAMTVRAFQMEMFQIPLVISRQTYAYAALIVLVSAFLSAIGLRYRLYRLNLIEVLKTRE
ncbi:ABC transporter permease [Longibacter salinarum]|nr:ABC transporter permease [Longibacter salinarum]